MKPTNPDRFDPDDPFMPSARPTRGPMMIGDDVDYEIDLGGSFGGGSVPSGNHAPRSSSSRANDAFSVPVRDALKDAFVRARKNGGIKDFKAEAEQLLVAAEKEYKTTINAKARERIKPTIGGTLFSAQEHAGEFAVQSDRAINAVAETIATDLVQEIEGALGRPRASTARSSRGSPASFNCFLAGTKVTMADGREKKIEKIAVGDRVLSCDAQTKSLTIGEVKEMHQARESGYYIVNGGLLKVTGAHLICTKKPNGVEYWAVLKPWRTDYIQTALEVGDALYTAEGRWVTVSSIKYVPDSILVYNLKTVDPDHTFFANGVLVHNAVMKV